MELNSKQLVGKIVQVLDDKKAVDIDVLDINNVSLLADYFIICSGNSTTQVKALADEVVEKLEELECTLLHREGYASARWILLDYGQVVIHLFHHESRSFYNLERLWSDAQVVDIETIIESV